MVEIEVGNRFGRAVRSHLACPYEASEALSHFNFRQVGRMEFVLVSKKAEPQSWCRAGFAGGIPGGPRRR